MSNAQPGWYAYGDGELRWWDGERWTEHSTNAPQIDRMPEPLFQADEKHLARAGEDTTRTPSFAKHGIKIKLVAISVFLVVGIGVYAAATGLGRSPSTQSSPIFTPVTDFSREKLPTPELEPTHAPTFEPTGSATFYLESDRGYSYEMEVQVHKPVTSGTWGTYSIGSICDFNPERDVAIPVKVTTKATTESFDTEIRWALIPQGKDQGRAKYLGNGKYPTRTDNRLRVEMDYSDSVSCIQWNSAEHHGYGGGPLAAKRFTNPVPNGEIRVSYLSVIIKDYVTPNTPNGDPELLDWLELHAAAPYGDGDSSGKYTTWYAGKATAVSQAGLSYLGEARYPEAP